MKKTYSTPNIQLHTMNVSNAFMNMSAAGENYGLTNGGNASENGNPDPQARGNNGSQKGTDKLDLI